MPRGPAGSEQTAVRKFLNRNFLLLIQGSWVDQLGTQVALVATMFWLRKSTNSVSLIGLLAATSAFPVLLLSPLGGALADRWFRRNTLIVWAVVCGSVSCSLMFLAGSNSPALAYVIAGILAGNFVLSCANAFTSPAFNALIPDVVAAADLPSAIAFSQASSLVAIICGQALGGLLLAHYAPGVLFGIDGATYFISAVAVCFVRSAVLTSKTAQPDNAWKRLWNEVVEGARYVWQRRGMRLLLLAAVPINLFTTPIFVFLPFYTTNALGAPLSRYGYLLATFSLGLFFGYGLGARLQTSAMQITPIVFGCVGGNALICLALSANHSYLIAAVLLFLFGAFTGIVTLVSLNALLSRSEPDKRGRVSAVLVMIAQGITPLAMSFVGVIGDMLHGDVRPVYAACGSLLLILAMTLFSNRDLREFLQSSPEPEREPIQSSR